jgi:hypothetical protein
MRGTLWPLALFTMGILPALVGNQTGEKTPSDDAWTSFFPVEKGELKSSGRNPFFVLEPGFQLVLEKGEERLTITVLDETRVVDGVETRVVEERETDGGEVQEVSRNFFAISSRTNGVFYFGEEVDMYEDGKLANHAGAWLAGEKGAKFGLLMPGEALLGARYYQEFAPGEALDRAEIVGVSESMTTPAGKFEGCLKTLETTPLEPNAREHKLYAPGVGLLQEGALKLVKYGKAEKSAK